MTLKTGEPTREHRQFWWLSPLVGVVWCGGGGAGASARVVVSVAVWDGESVPVSYTHSHELPPVMLNPVPKEVVPVRVSVDVSVPVSAAVPVTVSVVVTDSVLITPLSVDDSVAWSVVGWQDGASPPFPVFRTWVAAFAPAQILPRSKPRRVWAADAIKGCLPNHWLTSVGSEMGRLDSLWRSYKSYSSKMLRSSTVRRPETFRTAQLRKI